jgi:hypothetical protein
MADGQTRFCTGAPDVRAVSYKETTFEAAAKDGIDR